MHWSVRSGRPTPRPWPSRTSPRVATSARWLDPGDPIAQGGQRRLGSRATLGLALVGAWASDDGASPARGESSAGGTSSQLDALEVALARRRGRRPAGPDRVSQTGRRRRSRLFRDHRQRSRRRANSHESAGCAAISSRYVPRAEASPEAQGARPTRGRSIASVRQLRNQPASARSPIARQEIADLRRMNRQIDALHRRADRARRRHTRRSTLLDEQGAVRCRAALADRPHRAPTSGCRSAASIARRPGCSARPACSSGQRSRRRLHPRRATASSEHAPHSIGARRGEQHDPRSPRNTSRKQAAAKTSAGVAAPPQSAALVAPPPPPRSRRRGADQSTPIDGRPIARAAADQHLPQLASGLRCTRRQGSDRSPRKHDRPGALTAGLRQASERQTRASTTATDRRAHCHAGPVWLSVSPQRRSPPRHTITLLLEVRCGRRAAVTACVQH